MLKTNTALFQNLESARVQTSQGPRWTLSTLINLFHLEWNPRYNTITNIRDRLMDNKRYLMEYLKRYNNRHKHPIEPTVLFKDIIEDHVTTFAHDFQIIPSDGSTHYLHGPAGVDAYVSRFVAWALLNPDKPIDGGLFGRIYFMNQYVPYSQMNAEYQKFARIFARQYLTQSEKLVNGIARQHDIDIPKLRHQMNYEFFGNSDTNVIKMANGIPGNPQIPITNFLGASSLLAKHSALMGAIKKYRTLAVQDGNTFTALILGELQKMRYNMLSQNFHPERDLAPLNVEHLVTQRLRESFDFIKKNVDIMR